LMENRKPSCLTGYPILGSDGSADLAEVRPLRQCERTNTEKMRY
jgi:hypothetical protein